MQEDSKRIVFMGTPGFSIPALEELLKTQHQIVAVYTRPDKLAGRGRISTHSQIKKAALEHKLEVYQPSTLKDHAEVNRLAGLQPDLIVVVAYGLILPQTILDIPRYGCLNIHPSLLPKYRGPSPIASAILTGDEETGVTIMQMDSGMDTGPIASQFIVHIKHNDTTESLSERLAQVGARLLSETLDVWFEGSLHEQPQDDKLASYTSQIKKGDGAIDWGLSANDIWRQVRAFYPWPGSYTWWGGKLLRVLGSIPLHKEGRLDPGLVVGLKNNQHVSAGVETGDGVLGLVTVQLEGKRAMNIAEFVHGQKGFVGSYLGEKK